MTLSQLKSESLLSVGFAPQAHADARSLILGSMPGVASLNADQYYAFSRNAFWKIMEELFAATTDLEYTYRLQVLHSHHIALWDVIHACHRPGSLDSNIADDGLEINNFNAFFKQHPLITHIYFNGQKAADLFKKKVRPSLKSRFEYSTLPSTSPAHAALNFAEKLALWSVIKTNND